MSFKGSESITIIYFFKLHVSPLWGKKWIEQVSTWMIEMIHVCYKLAKRLSKMMQQTMELHDQLKIYTYVVVGSFMFVTSIYYSWSSLFKMYCVCVYSSHTYLSASYNRMLLSIIWLFLCSTRAYKESKRM